MWDIPLFKLDYDDTEKAALNRVYDSGWLTMGEETAKFEAEFAAMLEGEGECYGYSSCTAALHAALVCAGVTTGDEVVIPALTFVADANVVSITGATPVLADCASHDDLNVPLSEIKNRVTEKTKAIILVHFAGYPAADVSEIAEFCKTENIVLIEDVAHAPGAKIGQRSCGTFGDFGCFSFFSNKNLAVGEGGMLVVSEKHSETGAAGFRSHGMSTLTLDRHKGRAISYDVGVPGLNYRIDELRSALGRAQLAKLLPGNESRKRLVDRYRANLENSKVQMPFAETPKTAAGAFHIAPVILPECSDRKMVIECLRSNKIQTSIHYPPFWQFTAYSHLFAAADYPVFESISERLLTLPLFPAMTYSEVDQVSQCLLRACDQ